MGKDGLEVSGEEGGLFMPRAQLNDLFDSMIGGGVQGTNVDLDGVLEVVPSEALHLLRPRCGPHQRLAVGADLADDLADLGFKSHVKHPIRFIKHQVRHPTQIRLPALQHVNQAARRGDDYFDAVLQFADLGIAGDASVDAGVADSGGGPKFAAFCLNLEGQFTGWSQHEDNGTVSRFQIWLGIDVYHCRQDVCKGLARAGLCDTHHVPP